VGGVGTGYHSRLPYPICVAAGAGSSIRDLDGNIYIDYHLCYGALMAGHTNPHISAAIKKCFEKSVLVGTLVEDNIEVANLLTRNFNNPNCEEGKRLAFWRFTNSGTEATRDAIQLGE